MNRWRVHIENKPWQMRRSLHLLRQGPCPGSSTVFPDGDIFRALHSPIYSEAMAHGAVEATPFLEGNGGPAGDEVKDFLQAMLDAAWEQGLRPTGFADHSNELAAVRYHLEDMRSLARVKKDGK